MSHNRRSVVSETMLLFAPDSIAHHVERLNKLARINDRNKEWVVTGRRRIKV